MGASRRSKTWKLQEVTWGELLERLKEPIRTQETFAEYRKMSAEDKSLIKDVGGFVGGRLKGGKRRKNTVLSRSLITLDIDNGDDGVVDALKGSFSGLVYACYSTHSHTSGSPRLRVVVPLLREISPEEYEAVGRKLAEQVGFHYFDKTTFEPSRLMYWPSCASDGAFVFWDGGGTVLDPDTFLDEHYIDWRDVEEWPGVDDEAKEVLGRARVQESPLEKTGLIGAFCRTYTVSQAIDTFLADVYTPGHKDGRYTYIAGSGAEGLVIYDDLFAYSHHATDPASGVHVHNAYDIVRIHKFGDSKGSDQAMRDWVRKDEAVKITLATMPDDLDFKEEDFDDLSDYDWHSDLSYAKDGSLEKTLNNLVLILQNDEKLEGIRFNEFSDDLEVFGSVPWRRPRSSVWRDADDAQLMAYVARNYREFPVSQFNIAVAKVMDDRSYHPVIDYLDSLPAWDGESRCESLLIDCLGAEDNAYVREVTRKTLVAAIARVKEPGCKFDTMLVLCGTQGIGKSTLIARLSKGWFSDSLRLQDTKDKTAAEKLQGAWILEIGELAGLGKTDSGVLKSFLSSQNDRYRAAFGRRVTPHPRQCIFFGTTNAEEGFLRDETGGRRFFPINVKGTPGVVEWELSEDTVDQIWAEALHLYNEGETLFLSSAVNELAREVQRKALEEDPREGAVLDYLCTMVPKNWNNMTREEREHFLSGFSERPPEAELVQIDKVTYDQIWRECFHQNETRMGRKDITELQRLLDRIGWVKSDNRARFYGSQNKKTYHARPENR